MKKKEIHESRVNRFAVEIVLVDIEQSMQ